LEEEVVLYQRSENSSSDHYGIAPFDANKDLKKIVAVGFSSHGS
jgi:hypothetical protein